MKIALFGGSFDPIHYGHLNLAESAYEKFNLDKVIFIPSGIPPHKCSTVAHKIHRLEMIKLAIRDNPHFAVSDYELKKSGKSYTYQTIEYFKQKYPEDGLFFLIGIDLFLTFNTWKKNNQLLGMCKFLVGVRPGIPRCFAEVGSVGTKRNKTATIFKSPLIDISSTMLRKYIKEGKSVRYFLPQKVEEYILNKGLYR